jgi:hypothetical protein
VLEELRAVRHLLEAGGIGAVVDRCYTLDQIPEVHRFVEGGHQRGNVSVVV